ncbi:MAG: cytochrome c biogenesis CcdA family protein [Gloeobacterales cyanobacterium]
MSISLLGLALLAGLATIFSPCILPILPILVGRALQSHRYGPLALVLGLALSFALTGSLLGFSAQFLGPLTSLLRQGAIVLLFLLGVSAAFPKLGYRAFSRLFVVHPPSEPQHRGLWGEFWVGTQLGLVWVPCAGPILGSIITLVAIKQAILFGFVSLLAYALGAGIPMLAIAYSSQNLSQNLRWLYPHMENIQRTSGVLIAASAVAILLGWDNQLQVLLAPLFPPLPL